nr:uncharacterized protein LOC112770498 [Arachis hypogaea]
MFAPRTTPESQPSLKSVFQNKEALHEVDKRVARWLMDCRIPFNAVMSPFFQDMLDGVVGFGPGYKGHSYDSLRVNLLADLKRECQMVVESYRSAWKETGCTLMADGWTDQRQRTLINFLVYCKKGLCFVKSVGTSSMVKNASSLCDLFSEVIEWIGPDNIVHVVTDNAANYVAAGRLINKKFENIHWSPCAAHCLNLFLKDISSMPYISSLATRASKITVFVYNHSVFLSWLRQRTDWREIVCPGRSANGRAVSAIILDNKFWDDCFTPCQIVSPLIKLLMLVDADDKPSLEIVYEGMMREAPEVMRTLLDLVTLHCKVNNLDSVEKPVYLGLVREFYANMRLIDGTIHSYVKKVYITLNIEAIGTVLGYTDAGPRAYMAEKWDSQVGVTYKIVLQHICKNLSGLDGTIPTHKALGPTNSLLHRIITHILTPQSGLHNRVTFSDSLILFALVTSTPISFGYLMIRHM